MRTGSFLLVVIGLLAVSCSSPRSDQRAIAEPVIEIVPESRDLDGTAHGFPVMRDHQGNHLADGEFTQWTEDDRLHVNIRYVFSPDRWVEETSVIRQEPQLVQERWSWTEVRDGKLHRKFEIDFLAGVATAEKLEGEEMSRWSKRVDVEPGRAFAGSTWALAIRSLRGRLLEGEVVSLKTVGFTPAPRAATVEISHEGLDQLTMSSRTLTGDRFCIHPVIPWFAKPFVDVPDSKIWLTNPKPAAFLRFEGPFGEPDGPMIRVDLLPGDPSEPASRATP